MTYCFFFPFLLFFRLGTMVREAQQPLLTMQGGDVQGGDGVPGRRGCLASLALGAACFAAVAVLWSLLIWDVYDGRYGDQWNDGDYNSIVAWNFVFFVLVLVPIQSALMDRFGISWRGALELRGATPHAAHVYALLLPPLVVFAITAVLRARDLTSIEKATSSNLLIVRLIVPCISVLCMLWMALPTPLLRADRWRIVATLAKCASCLCGYCFFRVSFRATFVADIFTSLPTALAHFENALCFYGFDVAGKDDTQFCRTHLAGSPIATRFIEPAILASPFVVRLVQCTTSFVRALRRDLAARRSRRRRRRSSSSSSGGGDGMALANAESAAAGDATHPPPPPPPPLLRWEVFAQLANAAKYATALLVIFTATMKHWFESTAQSSQILGSGWAWAWVFAVATKTVFCFVWDVSEDWGLVSLRCCRRCPPARAAAVEVAAGGAASGAARRGGGGRVGGGSVAGGSVARGSSEAKGGYLERSDDTDDDDARAPWIRVHIWDEDRRLHPLLYLAAFIFNSLARMSWAFAVGPYQIASLNLRHVLSGVEIVRRAVWSVIRIEYAALRGSGRGSSTGDPSNEKSGFRRRVYAPVGTGPEDNPF